MNTREGFSSISAPNFDVQKYMSSKRGEWTYITGSDACIALQERGGGPGYRLSLETSEIGYVAHHVRRYDFCKTANTRTTPTNAATRSFG